MEYKHMMHISDQLWKKTKITGILNMFPEELEKYVRNLTPDAIVYAETYMPYTLWRWYHLLLENEHITPFKKIEFYQFIEQWPEKGQFFPKAQVHYHNGKIDFTITADYIPFEKQPILLDIINKQKGNTLKFLYGDIYNKHVNDLASTLRVDEFDAFSILSLYKTNLLTDWYNEFDYIGKAFGSFTVWDRFWKRQWKIMSQQSYYDTSFLLDAYILKMRKTFPDFGYLNFEQHEKLKEGDRKSDENYDFWNSLNTYMIIPFSLYCNLLAPVFKEREFFFEDFPLLLQGTLSIPYPYFSPCTFLSLTPFGNLAIDEIWT